MNEEGIVFTTNGIKAHLIEETKSGKFIIDPLVCYYEGDEEFLETSNKPMIVDRIFTKPPVEVIDEKIKEKKDEFNKMSTQLTELRKEKYAITRELEEKKTSLEKGIIDLSEIRDAKRITAFTSSHINPHDYNFKKYGCKISTSICIRSGELRCWETKVYEDDDSYSGCSNFVDPKYGFLIDKTDEEIIEIAKERASKKDWSDFEIERAEDKYLPDELIEKKKEIKKRKRGIEVKKIHDKIEQLQSSLKEMEEKS